MTQNDHIKEIIESVLAHCGITDYAVGIDEEELLGIPVFSVRTAQAKALIGARGATLSAFTHIVRKLLERAEIATQQEGVSSRRGPRFVIDVNGYQKKRIDEIKQKSRVYADRTRSFRSHTELEPMSGYERLIVHTVLANERDVRTESTGIGKDRRVIIHYVNSD